MSLGRSEVLDKSWYGVPLTRTSPFEGHGDPGKRSLDVGQQDRKEWRWTRTHCRRKQGTTAKSEGEQNENTRPDYNWWRLGRIRGSSCSERQRDRQHHDPRKRQKLWRYPVVAHLQRTWLVHTQGRTDRIGACSMPHRIGRRMRHRTQTKHNGHGHPFGKGSNSHKLRGRNPVLLGKGDHFGDGT